MDLSKLEHMLSVEDLHTENFRNWEKRSKNPVAKLIFKIAADKEANHREWIRILLKILREKDRGGELGITREDIEFWIKDEGDESGTYERMIKEIKDPLAEIVLTQIAKDELTNSEMLRKLLNLL